MGNSLNIHARLIEECKASNNAAQFQLYQLYVKAMLNTAFRILNNVEDAEDVTQEAFVNAFNNIHSYNGDSTFGAWLKRIVINKSLTCLKKNKSLLVLENRLTVESYELQDYGVTFEYDYDVVEVKQAIMQLPVGFRKVIVLYLIEGYDHIEISEILSISVSTSKSQYMRAKAKLRTILNEKKKYG